MRMKFGRYRRNPLGIGLQGLVQEPVRLYGLSGPTGPTLIQCPTQTVNIVIFAVFCLGCGEIAQETFFVLTASTPKVRLGAAHTTAYIRRVARHVAGLEARTHVRQCLGVASGPTEPLAQGPV